MEIIDMELKLAELVEQLITEYFSDPDTTWLEAKEQLEGLIENVFSNLDDSN